MDYLTEEELFELQYQDEMDVLDEMDSINELEGTLLKTNFFFIKLKKIIYGLGALPKI